MKLAQLHIWGTITLHFRGIHQLIRLAKCKPYEKYHYITFPGHPSTVSKKETKAIRRTITLHFRGIHQPKLSPNQSKVISVPLHYISGASINPIPFVKHDETMVPLHYISGASINPLTFLGLRCHRCPAEENNYQ